MTSLRRSRRESQSLASSFGGLTERVSQGLERLGGFLEPSLVAVVIDTYPARRVGISRRLENARSSQGISGFGEKLGGSVRLSRFAGDLRRPIQGSGAFKMRNGALRETRTNVKFARDGTYFLDFGV